MCCKVLTHTNSFRRKGAVISFVYKQADTNKVVVTRSSCG